MIDMLRRKISLEAPVPAFSGESRYLTPLLVLNGNKDQYDSTITNFELGADKIGPNNNPKIQDKIIVALKRLTLREERVLVQFWSSHKFGEHQYLTTIDQPFGLGVYDEGICSYKRDSERQYFVADNDHEEDRCPLSRVFRRGLPEWTPDVANYLPEHFPQQECAIRCNLHGYLALPVFDLNTRLCVGVLELLMSSKHLSYAYEVQQLDQALQTVDLRIQQAFDCPALNVPNESRQKDFDIINGILKMVCDIHSLLLAQTWAVSQHTTFVSHEKVIEKSCSSFDTRCVGKVCMFTSALPFHVKDLRMWPFLKACRERHLDRSHGFVGKALLSRSSCFCEDVTKLSEEEYPLVHHARMNGLTSCFAIFLHSVEANDDYVLEFFLPPDIKDSAHTLNLAQTLKQKIEMASRFVLGDSSCIQVVAPSTEVSKSLSIDPDTIQISSITTTNNNKFEMVTSDSESIMVNTANTSESSANLSNQWQYNQIYPGDDITLHEFNEVGASKNNKMISYPNVSMQKMSDKITDPGQKNNCLKQGRKRKTDSLTMEAVEKHVGKPIYEAAKSLGVSRSTLKRFCREHNMPSWPLPKHNKKILHITNLKPSRKAWQEQNLQRPSNVQFGLSFVVFLMVRVKRWRNKISMGNKALHNGDHPVVSESTAKPKYTINNTILYSCVSEISLVHASPKQTVVNISDIKMVTVKATFKDDMIKFQFSTSLGLLELEHEVARRIKLKNRRPLLKYRDEDDDLILLACDADLHHLLGFAAQCSTIKLIIMTDD